VVSTGVPELLDWARRLQAIAQTGIAYGEPSAYDRERYAQVRRIAAEMMSTDGGVDALDDQLAREIGHATPKLDVRGVVFRADEILLVRERAEGWWTLPGGWADVGESPSEAVAREVCEESGYETRVVKLLALYDRDRHAYGPHQWHIWKAVFLCELSDDEQVELESETDEAEFLGRGRLPELLHARATTTLIDRVFEHKANPEWPADFD
jgi:ADP-ribose pyrophosphatase YjhB (NUDIX family)